MHQRIVSIFLLAILIPTFFLAYFGLLAVRSERSIIEKVSRERCEFMADIITSEVQSALAGLPKNLLADREYVDSVVLGEAAPFKDQVEIFNKEGARISGPLKSFAFDAFGQKSKLEKAVFTRKIPGLSYTIAAYERYPLLFLEKQKQANKGFSLYTYIIICSALSILGAGFFTLWTISRQWRMAELKSEFVSALSHDLRRPLTSIRMFSEMLKDKKVTSQGKQEEYHKIINTESERLTHLANNILDFSRIESGQKKYALKPENLAELVSETVNRFRTCMIEEGRQINLEIENVENPLSYNASLSVNEGVSLSLRGPEGPKQSQSEIASSPEPALTLSVAKGNVAPRNDEKHELRHSQADSGSKTGLPLVKVDANAISQALMNLLTNADKFSPVDKEIKVRLFKRNKEAVVEVIDQGIGIDALEQKRVFQKFYRVPQAEVEEIEGSGLGLALVKYIAQAHRGRVSVKSEPGKGSTFELALPLS